MRPLLVRVVLVLAAAALVPALAAAQSAQTPPGRGYATVSGFYNPSSSFSDTIRPIQFGEAGVLQTSYDIGGSPGIEASGGVRIWRLLAVGAGVEFLSKSGTGSIAAQVPHPFYFNRQRAVSGDASDLNRSETTINVEARLAVPIASRWQAAVFGGPSWISVHQDLVSAVTVTESFPFDTAAFSGATSARRSGSGAGFNVGADLSFVVGPHVGVGGGIRFSRARVALSDTVSVDAGGPHANAGVRFWF